MFSHIFNSVTDFERAFDFYSRVFLPLGWTLRFCEPQVPWAGWHIAGQDRPLFLIGHPFDAQAHAPGHGQMVAFSADSRTQVDTIHAEAIRRGAVCEGPPGLRAHYHPHYYGAYFRDLDGNKLCVVCHRPQ